MSWKQRYGAKVTVVFVVACAAALALASPGRAQDGTLSACDPAPCVGSDGSSGTVVDATEPSTTDPTTTVGEPASGGDGATVEPSGSETTAPPDSTPVTEAPAPGTESSGAGTESPGSVPELDVSAPAPEPEQPVLPLDAGSDATIPTLDPSPNLVPAPEAGPRVQPPGALITLIGSGLDQIAPAVDWLTPASANPSQTPAGSSTPRDHRESRQTKGSPGESNTPLPPGGPSAPSPGTAGVGGGLGNGFSFECFAALVAVISIGVVRRRSRRSSLSTAVWYPVAFLSLPEQPG